jgi:hypothetical protein
MNTNFNFSNLNDEAKVNKSHIAQSPNDPNLSTLSNIFNKSQMNPQTLKNKINFSKQNSNGFHPEERRTINSKDLDIILISSILQSKNAVNNITDFPENQKSLNIYQNSNNISNFELSVKEKDKLNNLQNTSANKIIFLSEKENYENKSIYSLNSKDLEYSRINQNNITNSIHDGANCVNNIYNSNFPQDIKKSAFNNQIDFHNTLPNKINSEIFNLSDNLMEQSKYNPPIIKGHLFDRQISNFPFALNANPLNSHINTEQEINENDIIMMEENVNDKAAGTSILEEVRVGAYGGKINHPKNISKLNDTESLYEDAKSEFNTQSSNPIGVYGNFVKNNNSFNDNEKSNYLINEESKRNLSSEKNPKNNFHFTLKKRNDNQQNLDENINLDTSGNPYRRISTPYNPVVEKYEHLNKPINDFKNLEKSRVSQNPLTPNLRFKEEILGKSALDLEFNQNQSEYIFNEKKPFDEEILKNQGLGNNSFFSPNPIHKENFQRIFYNENTNFNEFKNFNLNEEYTKSRNMSMSKIDKNNLNNIQVIPFANEDFNSNIPVCLNNTNYKLINEQFFSDPDEENIKNHNFKLLLETEHSKSKLETRIRNDTNVNNFLDIRPDNSQLNFSGISNNVLENQRKDTETVDILKIPKSKPSNSVINNTVNYGNKIKTIFDEPNDENPNLSNINLRKISFPNEINKTANIIPNNINKIIADKKNLGMNNPNNININKANVVNYYNFNFNNNFKVNHDSQIKDLDLTLETKSIRNQTHPNETNTILKNEALETDKLIQEEEKQNVFLINQEFEQISQEFEPEILVKAKAQTNEMPTINIDENNKATEEHRDSFIYSNQPKEDIHFIIKSSDEKIDETIFENSIIEISKLEYKQLKNSSPVKANSESLTKIYGQDFLNQWNENAVIKIANNKKGVRDEKYFVQGFLNEYNLIDAVKSIGRDYIQSLDELDQDVKQIYKKPETNDILNVEEIFSLEYFARNPKNSLDQTNKKEIFKYLQKKATKTTFNKISYLYDNEILHQMYNISNEKIFFEAKDETVVFTSCINRNLDRDLISQLNHMNDINNEFANKKNLSVINEVDSVNETKRVKTTFNKVYQNTDGRIHLWRESICDGNSFYRMFMFGYLEHLIFEKNIDLLAKLFLRILLDYSNKEEINKSLSPSDQLDLSKIFQNINIERVLVIMNIIINQIRVTDFSAAYKSLLNALNDDDSSFDRVN